MRPALAALIACATVPAPSTAEVAEAARAERLEAPGPDPFAPLLDPSLAAGFSAPLRDAERCGDGCWTVSAPAPVLAIADGEVLASGDGRLRVRHRFLEDQNVREITAIYEGISPPAPGAVERGARLGQAQRVELRLEGTAEAPADFIAARPELFVPAGEPVLALVSRQERELRLYRNAALEGRFPVGFGQVEGDKEVVKDRKTPLGTYFVVQRSRGPFDGWTADYYGGIWLRLNYPNAYDAARGADAGIITPAQQKEISRAWRARKPTARDTGLGGGIGIHAWAYPWDLDGDRALSWGCLVVQPDDADTIYAALPEGTMVILF